MPTNFGSRLAKAFTQSQLCVGIDPHAQLLEEWGLSDSVESLRTFSETVISACTGRVGIVKPQVAFFERFGSRGLAVLEDVCEKARQSGLLVIADAKRGDIGSTMQGYFDAWLAKSAPFVCDALTVSPYLGFDSLKPFLAQAAELGKGVFVLAATSNPEAASLQQSKTANDKTIAADIWMKLEEVNQVTAFGSNTLGSFGAVVGATLNLNKFELNSILNEQQAIATPILAPGFGAQGARLVDAGRLFGASSKQVIASVSRSVLAAGPHAIDEAIDLAVAELAEGLS